MPIGSVKYVLIESHDPFENGDIRYVFDLAASLARAGNEVTLLLVNDAVRAAVAGEHTFWYAELARAGVRVVADAPSLRARRIPAAWLSAGVGPTETDAPVEALLEGRQALWITDPQPRQAA